ncbi:MAG: hypothetical protein EOP04_13385 [Proteobacteria bacterium]|nr:MAG: hypothetical protein EOP04_13385 [Pseudomonadota bacterium]
MTLKDSEDKTRELGLFNANIIKKVLIEDPILAKIKKVLPNHLPAVTADITFEELDNLNAHIKDPEQKFRKFYVTAFNIETCKTEIFSREHTPKVVIADAVRASMSIPIFFNHVTIREKNEVTKKFEDRRTLNKKTVVHYLDGGLLDNYPIWLFDDFKYILNVEEHMQNDNFSMQNPYTLGFRLVDQNTLINYVNPKTMPDEPSKNIHNSFFSTLAQVQL